jgi:5'-3' exonuclease, C-terminal SAM fold
MKPLIDADILLHELGWSGQFKDKETKEEILLDFELVAEMLDEKIRLICEDVEADEPPLLFLTNSEWLNEQTNKELRRRGEPDRPYVEGFRYSIGVTRPYKGTRHNPKPFHFYNIIAYLRANYSCVISRDGYEADDMMCMYQYNSDPGTTIICSRDKDLRICPGWHFSWECGKQKAIGPYCTNETGSLTLKPDGSTLGYGLKFFFYQMLVGDTADNIPGLPKVGDATAVKLLSGIEDVREMYEVVKALYKEKMGEKAKEYFEEQAALLWMVQEEGVGFIPPRKGERHSQT